MLTWLVYGMVYAGSALMVYNVYSYLLFAKRLRENKNWGKEGTILNFPIFLLVMFLIGYLVVGIFENPDLVMSGILFGGSIFVFVICYLMQRITSRVQEDERLEAQLKVAEKSNDAKTRFLSTMSHEMRTPLNAIIGMDTIILKTPSLPPEVSEQAEQIGVSARHLLELVNNILDMNRIEEGAMELKREPFSLREVLDFLDIITRNQCNQKWLAYKSSVAGEIDDCYIGDAVRLKEVLLNILGNAVKFTLAPGRVTFTTVQLPSEGETKMRTLRFTVQDTGIGMDEELLSKVFSPFVQGDDASTSRYGGSGLGLAISKRIVDMMGGQIEAKSGKAQGSTFTVTVPLEAAEVKASGEEEAPVPDGAPVTLEGRHVLIVEDVEINAEIVGDLLDMEGVTSDWAENGKIAVDMFSESPVNTYDAVLMDLRMPVMDGLDATRAIRALDRPDARAVPILALTANAFEEDVQNSLKAGMNAHLAKPVDSDALVENLKRFIAERKEAGMS